MFCYCLLINNKHIWQDSLFNFVTVKIASPIPGGRTELDTNDSRYLGHGMLRTMRTSFVPSLHFLRNQQQRISSNDVICVCVVANTFRGTQPVRERLEGKSPTLRFFSLGHVKCYHHQCSFQIIDLVRQNCGWGVLLGWNLTSRVKDTLSLKNKFTFIIK